MVVITDDNKIMYTIYYFELTGRAEVARLILEAAGVPYVNKYPVEWDQAEKAATPFGQLPNLLFTDPDSDRRPVVLAQTAAIQRYLARRHGLIPDAATDEERDLVVAKADMLEESIREYFEALVGMVHSEFRSAETIQAFVRDRVAGFIEAHTRFLKANGSNGFYIGSKLTYVELSLYMVMAASNKYLDAKCFTADNAPELLKVRDVVTAHPRLAEYFKSPRLHKRTFWAFDY